MCLPKLLLTLASLLLPGLVSCTPRPTTGPVKTVAGPIAGTTNAGGDIRIFRGIPFAAPPVGALRWQAPQPVKPWTEVRNCTAFGPSPMQSDPAPFSMWTEEFLIPKSPISEDCLYLNVWTGARTAAEKRPVLVWIYGGGFVSGGSAVPIYDGEAMAKKGIVFVSINYRVGVFGFFAHPGLSQESPNKASGNYGLMDQVAALQWVQQNIAAFGGDPRSVTVAGQSAGAMSVNCLVASPLARGLFNKAIAHSGASFGRSILTLREAEAEGETVAQSLGAASLADLRKVPAKELLEKAKNTRRPIVDGYVLPEPVPALFAVGRQNPVALLTGWNEDEGLSNGSVKSAAAFRQWAAEQYGANAKVFLQHYPAATDAEAGVSQARLSRDLIFGAQNYAWANAQSEAGKAGVYVYRFTRKVPATGEYVKYGAFHTGEVPYAYDNLRFVDRPWEPVDHALADAMSAYWASFARSGVPGGNGLPEWPAYTTGEKRIMALGEKPAAISLPDAPALDFLRANMEGN